RGAATLQRGGARLQHTPAPVPRLCGRVQGRLPAQGLLRGHGGRSHRAQGEVLACFFRHSSPSPSSCPPLPALASTTMRGSWRSASVGGSRRSSPTTSAPRV